MLTLPSGQLCATLHTPGHDLWSTRIHCSAQPEKGACREQRNDRRKATQAHWQRLPASLDHRNSSWRHERRHLQALRRKQTLSERRRWYRIRAEASPEGAEGERSRSWPRRSCTPERRSGGCRRDLRATVHSLLGPGTPRSRLPLCH